MKQVCLILTFFLFFHSYNFGQSLKIYDVDVSNYPKVKAKFFAYDNRNSPLNNLNRFDFAYSENTNDIEIDSVWCETFEQQQKLSTVLLIDMSGSMRGEAIQNARLAAELWIDSMANDGSECAIIGFSHFGVVFSNFSTNKLRLKQSLRNINPVGGTDFDVAFSHAVTGAFKVMENAKNKPVIVFLTDGVGTGNEEEIILKAKANSITVHSIAYGIAIPALAKNVAISTGGLYFSNLNNRDRLLSAYSLIQYVEKATSECSIQWTSKGCIENIQSNIKLPNYDIEENFSYQIDKNILPQFLVNPSDFVVFQTNNDIREVRFTAQRADIIIDSISLSNSLFRIGLPPNTTFPFTIKLGERFDLAIFSDNQADNYEICEIQLWGNACTNNLIFATSGKASSVPGSTSIVLEEPNGQEVYLAGSDTLITWKNSDLTIPVEIELSINAGVTWQNIGSVLGERYFKFKYPNQTSTECLIRLTQFSQNYGEKLYSSITDTINVFAVDWDASGRFIASGMYNGQIHILNAYNGSTSRKLNAHKTEVNAVAYSPDGIRLASVGEDSTIVIHNTLNRTILSRFKAKNKLKAVDWSNDGSLIVAGGSDSLVYLFRGGNYQFIDTLKSKIGKINDIRFSPDSKKILVSTDYKTIYVFTINGDLEKTLQVLDLPFNNGVVSSDWSFDGRKIVTLGEDRIARLYNYPAMTFVRDYRFHLARPNIIRYNPRSHLFASGGLDRRMIVVDVNTGEKLFDESCGNNVASLAWSPEGSRVVAGIWGANTFETIRAISINSFPQLVDISKEYFSLVGFTLNQKNVDLGEVQLGMSEDKYVIDLYDYQVNLPVRIDSIKINGINSKYFLVEFGDEFRQVTNTSQSSFVFAFQALEIGEYIADIVSYTSIGEFQSTIKANVVLPNLTTNNIDFGQVKIGLDDTRVLTIKNTSQELIEIDSVVYYFNEDVYDFNVSTIPQEIQEQSESYLDIQFSPDFNGIFSGFIAIYYNSFDNPAISLISGEGVLNDIQIDSLLTFSKAICDTLISSQFFISHLGTLPVSLIEINSIGFEIEKITLPFDLLPKEDHSILLYAQNIDFDREDYFLEFVYNDGSIEKIIVKVEFDLEFLDYEILALPQFQLISSNQSDVQELEIINKSNKTIEFKDFNLLLGTNFRVLGFSATTIEPNEVLKVYIEFMPDTDGTQFIDSLGFTDVCGNVNFVELRASSLNSQPDFVIQQFDNPLSYECADIIEFDIEITNTGAVDLIFQEFNSSELVMLSIDRNLLMAGQNSIVKVGLINPVNRLTNASAVFTYTYQDNPINKSIKVIIAHQYSDLEIEVFDVVDNKGKIKFKNNAQNIENITITKSNDLELSNLNFTLPAMGEVVLDYELLDSDLSTICFRDYCDSLYCIDLVNTSKKIDIRIVIETMETTSGQIIEPQIEFFKTYSNDLNITFDIEYNSTLLLPLSNEQAILSSSLKAASYSMVLDGASNYIQMNLGKFQTAWGNDSISKLDISNIVISQEGEILDSKITFENGSVKFLDICYAGGARLFDIELINFKNSINIFQHSSHLEIISENALNLDIDIYDILGNCYLKNEIKQSKNSKIDINYLSNGVYFAKISNGFELIFHKFVKN